ncbi:hypothetical protein THASP1DRAFT_15954, partial [Thamnocephalis sphaerospora]
MYFLPSSRVNVSIELQEGAAVLRGSPSESVGTVLRGVVVVTIAESARIRSIHARFRGRMRVWWSEGAEPHQIFREEKRTLVDRTWVFLPQGKHAHVMEKGVYRYPFEEMLRGDLPETIYVEYGSVEYRIKATVERPGLHYNCTTDHEVHVERHPYSAAPEWLEGTQVSDTWEGRVAYTLSIPTVAYGCDDVVPVHLDWQPEHESTQVRGVICTLVEHVEYKPVGGMTRRDQRCVAQHAEKFSDGEAGGTWKRTFFFRLPHSDHRRPTQRVQCDCRTEWIRVKHRLR